MKKEEPPKKRAGYDDGQPVILPPILYLGTYQPLLPSLQREGLHAEDGFIYLRVFPEVAQNDAEVPTDVRSGGRDIPTEWLDQIVILEVVTKGLELSRLVPDPQFELQPGDPVESFIYNGSIPPDQLSLYSSL